MKIAFVTPTLAQGGYEKVVVAYANELCSRGNQVDILCGFRTGELLASVDPGITVYDFQARARGFLQPLTRYLKKSHPDILYCGFREYNFLGVLAKRLARVKTCVYASQHGFQKTRPFMEKLLGRVIRHADRLLAVADSVADYEAEALGIDRKRFLIANNPVFDGREAITLERHPWFTEENHLPILVTCGRLAEGKGLPYALEIIRELNTILPARLLVLGDGPLKDELKSLSQSLGIEAFVDFPGFVSNPAGYMAQCDLLLHTALAEGFGNVVVEAMRAGITPCVTNCSGPMQIIENGKYGIDLGSAKDKDFVPRAAKTIADLLRRGVQFEGLEKRAAEFDVRSSTDQFLSFK